MRRGSGRVVRSKPVKKRVDSGALQSAVEDMDFDYEVACLRPMREAKVKTMCEGEATADVALRLKLPSRADLDDVLGELDSFGFGDLAAGLQSSLEEQEVDGMWLAVFPGWSLGY